MMDTRLRELTDKARSGRAVGPDEAPYLLDVAQRDVEQLLLAGQAVREHYYGKQVRMCSIVAGKLGGCGEDCAWCAQSCTAATEQGARVERTSPVEMLAAAQHAAEQGAAGRFGIVNSGRRPTERDLDDVIEAVRLMAADSDCDFLTCASLGEVTLDQARRLAAAGIRRYHHNLETSRRMFPTVVTTHSYDDRLATLRAAREAGMSLCCGGLFGIGETWDDRLEMALTIRDEVDPDCIPLNFLHPISGTRLADQTPLEPPEALTIIALFRLLLPTKDIKVAGGRELALGDQQRRMFAAGATSCLTGDYLTTLGQSTAEDLAMVADLGLEIVQELRIIE
ncbi:MAG: biotin synthase BioB [Planctomycetota bacterium]